MKKEDVILYREIQKNAQMGMKAIQTITGKVMDDQLSRQLSGQGLKYSEFYSRAGDKLLEGRAGQFQSNAIEDMMLVGGIHTNTFFNVSTSHIAEMVIEGCNKGVMQINKALNQCSNASSQSKGIAKEMVEFEEKSMETMKQYL